MSSTFIARLQLIHGWRLGAIVTLVTLLLVELIAATMDYLLKGKISRDCLITGFVATCLVAPPILAFLNYLLSEFAKNQQQKLEFSVRQANNRLNIAIQHTQIIVWEFNVDTEIITYDPTSLQLLGIVTDTPPHTLHDWLQLIHPDDQQRFMTHFHSSLQMQEPIFDIEYRIQQPLAVWGWAHTRGKIIPRDSVDKPLLAVGTTMNITTRKLAEIGLLEAKVRFELIFNNNPEVMLISRLSDGVITNVNQAFVDHSGYSFAEAIGNTTLGLNLWRSKEDRTRMTEAISKTGKGHNIEIEFTPKDGRTYVGSLTATITMLQGVPHIVSSGRDITQQKSIEAALRDSEAHAHRLAAMLRLMCDNVPDMIWAKDTHNNYLFTNKAMCEQLLYAHDTDEPVGKNDMYFALRERQSRPDDASWHTFGELCQDSDTLTLARGQASQFDEYGNVRGEFLFLDVHKAPFVNEQGAVIGVVGSARDVTAQRASDEKLRLAALVLENSSEAMFVSDAENRIVDVNPAFTKLTGYTPDEVQGQDAKLLYSDRHEQDFYQAMQDKIAMTGHWQGEIWQDRKNHECYASWLTINTVYHDDNSIHRRVALFSDISEKKKSEELIWHQANFDFLTALPNRRMFRERLSHELKKAHRNGTKLALLFLDLDHFKTVNDTLGHDLGDYLLVEAAQRILSCLRESDTVARLGGDEFTIILTELSDISCIERIANKIITSLARPFHLNTDQVYLSASIGITIYPDDALEVEDLLKNADRAMFVSKHAGRNRFSFYTNAMQEAALQRLRITNDLRVALAENQFQLYYQPIVMAASGRVHKAEALLRWFHPTRGLMSPTEFIPLAEESGIIHEIGDWVFNEVTKQIQPWRARYGDDFAISLNISPKQMQTKKHLASWLTQLKTLGVPGANLVFEITEGLLLDTSDGVANQLLTFRDAGIKIAIDDFGTGYSALAYLKKFNIDYLKIDQSFVRNLAPDSSDLALCEAIVVMAHKLGLKVIAEGIETPRQNNLLTEMGCDCLQGYLHSKPLTVEQFEAFVPTLQGQKNPPLVAID